NAPDDRSRRIQSANAEILKRRLAQFSELERSVKLVEGQLQSIENFFGLVNDQVVTLPTPERVSSLDFEQLSDSIAMTKQMLEETSDTFAALDSHNRDSGNYQLLLSNSGTGKKKIRLKSALMRLYTLYSPLKQSGHNIWLTLPG